MLQTENKYHTLKLKLKSNNFLCGGARAAKGGGLRTRWLRPAWVRIPPAASRFLGDYKLLKLLYKLFCLGW